ncbi:MAG TPA: N-6 DNA methylase [Candidatus Acidoferrales bacterium]|nr:N-6 DNA methylase [Candidatus Acidoferrales bacterium]
MIEWNAEPDILERAYEYLPRKFADGLGQSAGEFYTPKEVGWLMAHLIDAQPHRTVYDPALDRKYLWQALGSLGKTSSQKASRSIGSWPGISFPATRPHTPYRQKNRKASFRNLHFPRFQSGELGWQER